MNIDTRLLSTAERLFDRDGFHATSRGHLVAERGLSSRTVYQHIGSKNALMARVLAERSRRFFESADFTSTSALFDSLVRWAQREGARSCLFFRLRAETGAAVPEIEAAVSAYHARLHERLAALVRQGTGAENAMPTDQILAWFEGATTAASYRGSDVIEAAKGCAADLIELRKSS